MRSGRAISRRSGETWKRSARTPDPGTSPPQTRSSSQSTARTRFAWIARSDSNVRRIGDGELRTVPSSSTTSTGPNSRISTRRLASLGRHASTVRPGQRPRPPTQWSRISGFAPRPRHRCPYLAGWGTYLATQNDDCRGWQKRSDRRIGTSSRGGGIAALVHRRTVLAHTSPVSLLHRHHLAT